jgi:hypothetical protein
MINNTFKKIDLEIPVLIIGFNRPNVSIKTFEYIRQARPHKLYIAIDAARPEVKGEDILVQQVKDIYNQVDWTCETHYKFNEKNKGAEVTVSTAISWVFQTEEYAIILEDDIVAPLSFLYFAQEMLKKYKDDDRIGTVTGSNFTPIPVPNNTDYFFAKYGHSWGWATWKRNWNDFDLNVKIPEEHLGLKFLGTITNSKEEAKFYQRYFRRIKEKGPQKRTWDEVGNYLHRINNRLSIIPRVNLTSNIGIFGVHAKGKSEHHYRPFDENFLVKKHPDRVECYTEYDIHHFNTYINKKQPIAKRILNKIKRIIKTYCYE